jgi:hypothetical protein
MKNYFTGELILDEKTISLPVKLGETNLIIFPDWAASEEEIYQNLEQAIRALATHLARSYITLLVDIRSISEDDANLFLSDLAMNLFMQEDLDITEGLEIYFVGQLNEIQWKALLPRLKARIILDLENPDAIALANAANLPSCELDSLSEICSSR